MKVAAVLAGFDPVHDAPQPSFSFHATSFYVIDVQSGPSSQSPMNGLYCTLLTDHMISVYTTVDIDARDAASEGAIIASISIS